MKTITPSQLKGDERKWYIIDAKGQTLGRLATQVAKMAHKKIAKIKVEMKRAKNGNKALTIIPS